MKFTRLRIAAGVAALGIAGVSTAAIAHDRAKLRADLIGYEEVPSISTDANGTFRAQISRGQDSINYSLTYKGPFNSTATQGPSVTQAHIHVGQEGVNGGISVWLCANNPPITNAPAGTQVCPQEGTISGTITAANVVGPTGQGIQAGEFHELLRALRAGVAYANVHTVNHGGGEIRGQIGDGDRGHDRD